MAMTRPDGPASRTALEGVLAAVEDSLGALGEALRHRDAAALETHALALQAGLQRAVDTFGAAARRGHLSEALRSRLIHLSTQVAAQRESLSRATAALDRAMDALWPGAVQPVYGLRGHAARFNPSRYAPGPRA